jgi:mitochondrial fission process protein 1
MRSRGPDSTDTNLRYAAYANRLRTIMLSAHRYVAYTSDIGESFRPVAHPYMVRGAYAVSWAYLIGDVSHEGWKAYQRNSKLVSPQNDEHFDATAQKEMPATKALPGPEPMRIPAIEDYRAIMAQRAVFQSVASMGLPAFTIHSIVRYSGKAFKNAANATIRTWAPIGLGLAAVPALPYMFDEPVEKAVEWTFYHAFKAIGGDGAVGNRPVIGRSHQLVKENRVAEKLKEKEKQA